LTDHEFAVAVEAGDHLGAIERFYAPDVASYENQQAQAGGRDAFHARERATLASVQAIKGPRFELVPRGRDARVRRGRLQTWRGQRIVEERFHCDPGQLR